MAPDYIHELALLEVSRWQRQAWEKKMWRKDVQDTIDSCKEDETPFDLYLMGYVEPHHPLPTNVRAEINGWGVFIYDVDHYYTAYFGPICLWI